jgi:hypothetical protein
MKKFEAIIYKYSKAGISINNIDFAIDSVKDGSKREHILESLTADYRGLDNDEATALLEELFAANGGEFKKENQGGYLYGTMFLLVGITCSLFIASAFYYREMLMKPALFVIGAFGGLSGGIYYLTKAIKGKFRDSDEPFKE